MAEFADFEIPELDLEGVKEWDGESAPLVPPGDYTLTVVDISSETGAKGPYAAFTFEVQDDGEQKGMKVFQNYSFSKAAIGRIKQLALACGAPLQGFIASNYMGTTIMGTVYHQSGGGGVGPDGNVREARDFANLKNERPLQTAPATTAAKPPVSKAAPAMKPAANNAARRA